MKFWSKCKTSNSWKCIWRYHLRHGGNSVQGEDECIPCIRQNSCSPCCCHGARHIRRHRIGFCSYTDLEMFFHPWPWPKTQDPDESDCPYFPALITYDTEMAFTGFPKGIDDNQLINMGIVSTCVVDFKSKSRRCIKHTIFIIRRRHIARNLQKIALKFRTKHRPKLKYVIFNLPELCWDHWYNRCRKKHSIADHCQPALLVSGSLSHYSMLVTIFIIQTSQKEWLI